MATEKNAAKRHQYKVARTTEDEQNAPRTAREKRRARKEKAGKGAKYVLVAIGVAAMVLSVSTMACAGVLNQAQTVEDGYELTGGVAATVDGATIGEDTITRQIMSTRTSMGYESDADWANYLSSNGMTPESYRENLINSYARQYLLQTAVKEYGITVSDDEIEDSWQDTVANYDSEQDFIDMLAQMGMTEDSYRESLASSLAQEKLRDKVAPVDEPTDDEIIAYANENLASYNDARRSSHILFKVAEDADDATREAAHQKAQEVLDKLNAGEMTFEDAAKEYSEDGSADNGGDVGWDKLTTFVTEYQDALSQLAPGQMSGIVETTYGYHIIMCTDLFHVDGQVTSIDQIPEELRTQFAETIKSNEQQTAYTEWFDQYVEDADIKINPMPEDVPYNVNMDAAASDDSGAEGADDGASTDASGADAGAEE